MCFGVRAGLAVSSQNAQGPEGVPSTLTIGKQSLQFLRFSKMFLLPTVIVPIVDGLSTSLPPRHRRSCEFDICRIAHQAGEVCQKVNLQSLAPDFHRPYSRPLDIWLQYHRIIMRLCRGCVCLCRFVNAAHVTKREHHQPSYIALIIPQESAPPELRQLQRS